MVGDEEKSGDKLDGVADELDDEGEPPDGIIPTSKFISPDILSLQGKNKIIVFLGYFIYGQLGNSIDSNFPNHFL